MCDVYDLAALIDELPGQRGIGSWMQLLISYLDDGSAEAAIRADRGVMRMLPTSDSVTLGNLIRNGVTCFGSRRWDILSKLPSVAIVD